MIIVVSLPTRILCNYTNLYTDITRYKRINNIMCTHNIIVYFHTSIFRLNIMCVSGNSLCSIRLNKIRLNKIRLNKIRLNKIRLNKIRLNNILNNDQLQQIIKFEVYKNYVKFV